MTNPTRERNKRGQGERLRTEVIAAAGRLLEQLPGGTAELSLRAVAREAGVAAPSLYAHFSDKSEIVSEVLGVRFAEFGAALDAAAAQADTPLEELHARCLAYCRFAQEYPGSYRVMFEMTPTDPTPRALSELPGSEAIESLVVAVGRCLPGDTDPFGRALGIWAGLHGHIMLRQSKPALPWPSIEESVAGVVAAYAGG